MCCNSSCTSGMDSLYIIRNQQVFSIEVLLIAISSCITSDFIVSDCFELDPIYYMPLYNSIPIADFWKLILLALIMGLMGVLYNITLQATQKLYSLTKSIWIKIFIPVVATAILHGG